MSHKIDFSRAGRDETTERMLTAVKGSIGHVVECLIEIIAARVVEVARLEESAPPPEGEA